MEKLRTNSTPPPPPQPRTAQASADTPDLGTQNQNHTSSAEKRSHLRYPISADAVIIEARSRTRLRGRASDLSLSGCYLDAINLFPVGTPVHLRLTAEDHTFECQARVTYSMPGMGMGLAFTDIHADQSAALHDWLAELSEEPTASAAPTRKIEFEARTPEAKQIPDGLQEAFSELVTILHRKGVLGESEIEILRNKLPR
jgi:hypothetical protein